MRPVSLTTKLLGICSGTLIIMFGACLYMFLKAVDHQSEAVRGEFLTLAKDMESKLGMQFFDRYGDVLGFAQNSILQTKNTAEITKAFNNYINIFQTYDLIMLVDMTGQLVASSSIDKDNTAIDAAPLLAQSYADSNWFTNTVNERFTEDPNKKLTGVYFEDFMIDPITTLVYRGKRLGISFSAPVRDENGKMVGVISVRSSLRWIENEFTGLYRRLKDDDLTSMEMVMLNKKGDIVIDYDPSRQNASNAVVHDFDNTLLKINLVALGQPAAIAASQGKEGTLLTKHARKNAHTLNAFTSIKDEKFLNELSWCLLFQVEDDILLGSLLQAKQQFIVVSGVVLVVCVLGSGFFAIRLSRRLQRISEHIAQSGRSVDNVAHQLSNANVELSSGETEVASSLDRAISSLEELASLVKTNKGHAGEASALTQHIGHIAKEGENEVQKLIGAISDINRSSKTIGGIVNVIDDIAFQTNLLAVNAAIEAVRAGEQGKIFAVVAEAVRNLAQRSGIAAGEITSLISENVDIINRGNTIADRSGQVLQNILFSVRRVEDLNKEIAGASQEQSSGLTQISNAMNEIDHATLRNAAASGEVASSTEELSHQATTLQNMVNELAAVVTGHETTQVPLARSNNVMALKRSPVPHKKQKAPVAHTKTQTDEEPAGKISSVA